MKGLLCHIYVVVYSKTSLTRTSGDHPKTSVLTEACVIQNCKNQSYSTIDLITHTVKAAPIPIQCMIMSAVTV